MLSFEALTVAFFDWSVADSTREVTNGFRFLSRPDSRVATAYVFYCSTLKRDEKLLLATGMAKRFQEKALLLKGERMIQEEEESVRHYIDWYCAFNAAKWTPTVPQPPPDMVARFAKLPKRVNKTALMQALRSRIGNPDPEWLQAGGWCYRAVRGGVHVRTSIDVGGRIPLRYLHTFGTDPSPAMPSLFSSLYGWMGLGSVTDWDLLTPDSSETAVILMKQLVDHFLNALPVITREAC
jgi:hypothetical protein